MAKRHEHCLGSSRSGVLFLMFFSDFFRKKYIQQACPRHKQSNNWELGGALSPAGASAGEPKKSKSYADSQQALPLLISAPTT